LNFIRISPTVISDKINAEKKKYEICICEDILGNFQRYKNSFRWFKIINNLPFYRF
jgi:hypothetical protein